MIINVSLTKRWYLTLIASFYLVLCGLSSMRYLAMDISIIEGYIGITTQLLCFGATIAAAIYFFRPAFGCLGLLIISLCALVLSVQASDSRAIVYHCMIVAVLIIPILGFLRRRQPR